MYPGYTRKVIEKALEQPAGDASRGLFFKSTLKVF